jgi:hypothetical protein
MSVKPFNLLLIAIIFIAISGCQKELSSLRSGINKMTLDNFFNETTTSSLQTFSLNTSNGGTIKGGKGSNFSFRPLSFVDLNGNLIRGDIKLQVLEVLTPADMILNNAPTMSNDLPLESGGAFYIKATYNNAGAKLAPGNFLKIDLVTPSASLPGMRVFSGYVQDTTRSVNWVVNNSPGNTVTRDSSRNNNGIDTMPKLFSDSLNWINCDRFVNEPKIHCNFLPENNPDEDSTAVFVQFTGRNSVTRIYQDANNGFGSPVLIAGPATIVGICIKDQKLYTSIISVSLQGGKSFALKFAEDTKEQLKSKLQSLK